MESLISLIGVWRDTKGGCQRLGDVCPTERANTQSSSLLVLLTKMCSFWTEGGVRYLESCHVLVLTYTPFVPASALQACVARHSCMMTPTEGRVLRQKVLLASND